ncbi:hypothetical protein EV363DRAFT_1379663, partial [Boletus edulis]
PFLALYVYTLWTSLCTRGRREEEAEGERMDERDALRPGTGARLAGWGVSCEGGWERLAGACARQSGSRAPDPREVSCEAPEWEWRQ